MNKIDDIDIVNYIINKGATAKETAEHFNVSLSTIKKRLNNIKSELDDNSDVKKGLLSVIASNQEKGRVKGGMSNNSGPKIKISIEEIAEIAIKIIADNLTLEEAANLVNIPTSTLYEYFKLLQKAGYSDLCCDLQSLFEYHKKNKSKPSDIVLFKMREKYNNLLDNNKKVL